MTAENSATLHAITKLTSVGEQNGFFFPTDYLLRLDLEPKKTPKNNSRTKYSFMFNMILSQNGCTV